MSALKRTNWTNEEVIDLILGNIIVNGDGEETEDTKDYNDAVRNTAHTFEDFKRPVTDFSAMAYNPEDKFIYHIGPPLPQRNPPSEKDKEAYTKWEEARKLND